MVTATSRSMNKTNVCAYCDTWAGGGIEAFLTGIITHMNRENLNISIMCACKSSDVLDDALNAAGLAVKPLAAGEHVSTLKKILISWTVLPRILKKEKCDVLHLNIFHSCSLFAAVTARLYGVKKVIVHCHGAGFRMSKTRALKYLIHYIIRWLLGWAPTDRWATSQQAADFMFLKGLPVQIIRNGIEVERFTFDGAAREQTRKLLHVDNKKVLGCVGRIDSQKNQIYLLQLLFELKSKYDDAVLLLVGEGNEKELLEQKAQQLQISESVIFYGYSTKVQELLWAMDVLLVPSLTEGFCIAALEAQAAGLPVVCSCGIPDEVVVRPNVHFADLAKPQDWLSAIEECFDSPRIADNSDMCAGPYHVSQCSEIIRRGYERIDASSI